MLKAGVIAPALAPHEYGILIRMCDQDLIHLMDPETNIRIGAAFLRYLKVQYFANYGNGYVAAYNEGEGNLLKGIPDQDYVNAFNAHLNELDAQTSDSHEQPKT